MDRQVQIIAIKRIHGLLIFLILVVIEFGGFWGCSSLPRKEDFLKEALLRQIEDHYFYKVDRKKLQDRSVKEIMQTLDGNSSLKEVSPSSLDFIRGLEEERSVGWSLVSKKCALLKIGFFGRRTLHDLKGVLAEIRKNGIRKLIFDLRGNGGGNLKVAQESYRHLFPFQGEKWIVLVDRKTASSAEFFADALRSKATLVGERTAGKGTFQKIIPLGSRHLLFLTAGKVTLVKGGSIPPEGLKPDRNAEGRDAVRVALEMLGESE